MNVKFKTLLLLLLPVWACAHNGDIEFKRTVVKEFNVNNNASLDVFNKYGKIVVHTWNRNQVKATIVITGFGKNTAEAREIANGVEIQTNAGSGNVTMQTSYNAGKGGKWFSWGDKRDSKEYVNIDYELYVPRSLGMLTLENNFGDVITDQLPFAVKMNLNYCFYAVKEVAKKLEMSLNYCEKGRIDKAGDLVIRSNYSDVHCDAAGSVDVRSNYSDYTLGNLRSLTARSNYSDYKVRQLGSIDATSNYSDIVISSLRDRADLKLVYSDFKAEEASDVFKGGEISLTYSDLELGLSPKCALQIAVDLNYGDLKTGDLPLKNISSVKRKTQLTYTAITNSGGEQSPRLSIRGVRSDVDLSGGR
ncbi:hypothetical protein [Chitinophaga japonensis]|uniref:Adhesin domain-containing protein n=1 Tax=Chitinophaga japonensis TaxID=104662 RepID=A0A562SSR8_CHIJA|nr:hypothetical protein [Chitinophaga japonensis]TWI84307.1 hypothetical protein LX66_4673 [Chitinophaga japonensis]